MNDSTATVESKEIGLSSVCVDRGRGIVGTAITSADLQMRGINAFRIEALKYLSASQPRVKHLFVSKTSISGSVHCRGFALIAKTAVSAVLFLTFISEKSVIAIMMMFIVQRAFVCRFLCRARYAGEHLHNNPRPEHLQDTYQRCVYVMRRRLVGAMMTTIATRTGRSRAPWVVAVKIAMITLA